MKNITAQEIIGYKGGKVTKKYMQMAHEMSKDSTILIIKYNYIKIASYLFLTIEVAKIKRKDNNECTFLWENNGGLN